MVALAVASSGIAATLLEGGRTAHALFKLPLNLSNLEYTTCNISRNSPRAILLQQCKLIVWDECTMSHKASLEALDTTLRDLRHTNKLLGGITMVLSGDFRQTLPVIPRGTKSDELQACIKNSFIWNHTNRLRLITNMRVHFTGNAAVENFAETLIKVGNGTIFADSQDGSISTENIGNTVETAQELQQAVFPNLRQNYKDRKWLTERAILAPTNDAVSFVNEELLSLLPGSHQTYTSFDTVTEIDQAVNYPTEVLNSFEIPGVPHHTLKLKLGAPIMLLRNLDPPTLCNGTRMIVKKLLPNIIEATIITGHCAGQDVFIPRIPIIPSDVPFNFKRVQFPIRLSFAMSISKAQGQSLKVVGLDLQKPCFSHGQLYVGCSRVGSKDNLCILAPNKRPMNIVYREVLQE